MFRCEGTCSRVAQPEDIVPGGEGHGSCEDSCTPTSRQIRSQCHEGQQSHSPITILTLLLECKKASFHLILPTHRLVCMLHLNEKATPLAVSADDQNAWRPRKPGCPRRAGYKPRSKNAFFLGKQLLHHCGRTTVATSIFMER